MRGLHVNRLYPEKQTIASVAPLVGRHELADDPSVRFCDVGATQARILEHRLDTPAQQVAVQGPALGFARQGRIGGG